MRRYTYYGLWPSANREMHGQPCTEVCRGQGPGPRNVLVRMDAGDMVIVPKRYLRVVRD